MLPITTGRSVTGWRQQMGHASFSTTQEYIKHGSYTSGKRMRPTCQGLSRTRGMTKKRR
jgi:hypothetical protein